MSISLNENLQRIQLSAEAFAEEFLEPIAADLDRNGTFPRALVAELARQQLLALPVVKHAGFTAHVAMLQTLSQSCAAVASIVNNHALTAHAIFKWGSEAQKFAHLSALAQGEQLGGLAVHEITSGANALTGTVSNGKLTLNGKKLFVRNAGVADIYVVFATIGTSFSPVIVPAKTPGLAAGPARLTMGLRGCPVADLTFNSVTLDDSALLGSAKDSPALLAELLGAQALGEAAQTTGIGKAAAKHAANAARHRVQFGHPIASLQAIQQLLAEIATDTHLAWLGIRQAAQLLDDGAPFLVEAAMVKSFLGRFGQKILIDAIQVEGGMGICETAPPHFEGALPLARMFRDIAGTTLLDAPAAFPEAAIAAAL
jgi:butyryl-CoA dehydrogenase